MKNQFNPRHLRNKPPSSKQILLVILLGAIGLLITLTYLFSQLRYSGFRQERWAVRDSVDNNPTKPLAKSPLLDTLLVTIHPGLSYHNAPKRTLDTSKDLLVDISKIYFNYNPVLLVWMSLIAVMIACSVAILPVTGNYIRDVYLQCKLRPKQIYTAIVYALITGVLILLTNACNGHMLNAFDIIKRAKILVKQPEMVYVFVGICLLSALVAVCGQLVVNEAISKLPDSIVNQTQTEKEKTAGQFMLLRNSLKFFLMVDATLIVFSVLTTDSLRRAIIAELTVKGHYIFPQEFVYLYGLLFTIYLALLYLPIYYRLKYKGETMTHGLQHDELAAGTPGESFLITESALDSLKVTLSILAPVVSSLLPNLLNIK